MNKLSELDVDLNRDSFLRELLRQLSGTLESVVGIDEAEGYISMVGNQVGHGIDESYRNALQVDKLNRGQVAAVLVDLKARIRGEFSVVEETEDRIVFHNTACPFAEKVEGRPSLCMMTSNVFGTITAENLGYARVELNNTIARGDGHCQVTVYLKPTDEPLGREYFGS